MTRIVLISLAGAGVVMAVIAIILFRQPTPTPPVNQAPPVNPYASSIAAEGIVEGFEGNRPIDVPQTGLVLEIMAEVGDEVRSGDPLFRIDDRVLRAERLQAEGALKVAEAERARLKALPRPERIDQLEAALAAAEAEVTDATTHLERVRTAVDRGAATAEELSEAVNRAAKAKANRDDADAALRLEQPGAWAADLAVAEANVQQAKARIASIGMQIDRLTVTAPSDGTILKRNIDVGQSVTAGNATPAMVLGELSRLRIRAKIDEEDVQKFEPEAPAIARVRGGEGGAVDLRLLRVEPLALDKVDLTGMPAERVDTRVVDVLFLVDDPHDVRLYPGILVDVFIEAPQEQEPQQPR